MLLNYHIGSVVLGLLCVGVRVRFGWFGIQCGSSTYSQSREDGYINARKMLSI